MKSLKPTKNTREIIRVNFSFKREVFFVVIGAFVGAVAMVIPKTLFEVQMGLPYYLTWLAFGHIAGVYSSVSASIIAGAILHIMTAISIGVVTGIFLYKSNILNISKPTNGIIYGLITGIVVFTVFFIPVNQFVLSSEIINILPEVQPFTTEAEAANMISKNQSSIIMGSIVMHLVFGVTLGIISSLLEIKFGAKYRCPKCEISFSRIDSLQKHLELVHGTTPIQRKRILILGGGFAGIEILRILQNVFQDDVEIDITLVSRDNFFLFTPMLPEVSSGMIETRHIVTPIRAFCKRARFYEANVESIDLENKQVIITKAMGDPMDPVHLNRHVLNYDYLVIGLGGETNFFGMKDLERNAFTLKTLEDAIILRNHVISMLEQADLEHGVNVEDNHLRKSLMTFVVVGGGFGGVEAVGELNALVRDSIEEFYHNIDIKNDVRVILVNAHGRILPEVSEDLSDFALQKLREGGVEVILNKRLASYTNGEAKLNDGTLIPSFTLIWAGGVTPSKLIKDLTCEHDKGGRIVVNNYLQVPKYDGVFALGDCASITDPHTKKPYPPTAQHAIREGKAAAKNLISIIKNRREKGEVKKEEEKRSGMKIFDYKTKGTMAEIGKRTGVGDILGLKVYGFVAWWIWRTYYLANLPTVEKKVRVMIDWTVDLFFKRDVTKFKTFVAEEKRWEQEEEQQDLSRVRRVTEASKK